MDKSPVRPVVKLKSPNGVEFETKWTGGTRSFVKRLAKYNYINTNGTVIDDFGVESDTYPMSLIFDSEDFAKKAELFISECKKPGKWDVIHPTKGLLGLQLASLSENDQPVTNALSIVIDTEWLEYLDPKTHKTRAQMLHGINSDVGLLDSEMLDRYKRVKLDTFSDRSKLSDFADKLAGWVDKALGPISKVNAEIAEKMLRAQRDLQSIINSGIVEPLKLASLIQETIRIPIFAGRDLARRLKALQGLATDIFDRDEIFNLNGNEDRYAYNEAATVELALAALLGTMATLAITSDIQTREDAIALIEALDDLVYKIAENLDVSQKALKSALLEDQYFSMGSGFNVLNTVVGSTKDFLITSAIDLKVATYITLQADSPPAVVAVAFYGDTWDNTMYDFFIESNDILGDELFMLRKGRKLVRYV